MSGYDCTYAERASRLGRESKKLTENCRAHDCPYLKRFSGVAGNTQHSCYLSLYCGYLDVTGHARSLEPENKDPNKCTHWQDEIESNKTTLINNPF